MKPSTVFFVLALLTACGVTHNQVIGSYPDGSIAQQIVDGGQFAVEIGPGSGLHKS